MHLAYIRLTVCYKKTKSLLLLLKGFFFNAKDFSKDFEIKTQTSYAF